MDNIICDRISISKVENGYVVTAEFIEPIREEDIPRDQGSPELNLFKMITSQHNHGAVHVKNFIAPNFSALVDMLRTVLGEGNETEIPEAFRRMFDNG